MKKLNITWQEVDNSVANEDTWADMKFGKWCDKCKRRKGTINATKGAEGGKNSICECDKN